MLLLLADMMLVVGFVQIERGYDVNFVVQREDDSGLCLAAEYVSAAMSSFMSMPVFCFVWAFRLRLRDNPHTECGRGIAWLIPNRDVACGASRQVSSWTRQEGQGWSPLLSVVLSCTTLLVP